MGRDCGVRCGSLPTPADFLAIIRMMQGSWIGYLSLEFSGTAVIPWASWLLCSGNCLQLSSQGAEDPKSKQVAHVFADAMFAVVNDSYNITALLPYCGVVVS
jgi:hypothetical protein